MDFESLGAGGGSGLFVSILTYIGIKQRLDRTDNDVSEIKKAVVFKDVHGECSQSWHLAIAALERKIDDGNKLLAAILERMK